MNKVAFIGFRHGHILSLYDFMKKSRDFTVVAACEEHEPTRASVAGLTHTRYAAMLDEVDCDIVAVGDYYGIRGRRIIEALKRGKHVVTDKPICTSLTELREIERLARAKKLKVSSQLDSRGHGAFLKARELVQAGQIGEIHAIHITGQHPLMLGKRPGWYFEKGKHGGTINDIAIHAFDFIPWMTGLRFDSVVGARAWNAFAKATPHFKDAAQFLLRMKNGAGLMGDVSYFMPDSHGYRLPQYWRVTLYGRDGVIEAGLNLPHVMLARNGEKTPQLLPPLPGRPFGYLDMFTGKPGLNTRDVLDASRIALLVQRAADTGKKSKL